MIDRAADHHNVMAAIECNFTLPVPPSANRYWRIWRNRIVVTDEARSYKQEIRYTLAGHRPFDGDVVVNFTVFRPRKKGDLDNYAKIMLDALQSIAYHNDSQIVEIHSFREDDKDNPRVEILIYEAI
jgi:crossover junction endodeoxyribonuclease RusA